MSNQISKEKLKSLALALKFDMNDEEYETLQDEFNIILKQMQLIDESINTDEVLPLSFPFETYNTYLRDDEEVFEYPKEEILKNAKEVVNGQIKVKKVVE